MDATLAINPWSSSFGVSASVSGMVDGHHGMHQSVLHCGWCVGHLCVSGLSHGEHHVSSAMAHHALVVCVSGMSLATNTNTKCLLDWLA